MREIRPETVIFIRNNKNEILLVEKPHLHYGEIYIPLGDLVKDSESTFENVRRNCLTTGLEIADTKLKGLVTEVSKDIQWHLFIYLIEDFKGETTKDVEGHKLQWISIVKLDEIALPQADKVYAPIILSSPDFYEAKYTFDDDMKLVKTESI
ncbi:MAG: NUDIX domain-containing protein [Candidatus Dojkabacteria bacterium]|nr:NUDIX domain-containing protein [Candidatus Dojkabacteria bacterium]MDQ7021008.1 NUDIX domain-containing protein [Candidatus Dojkabacteria bacterium]